MTEGSVKAKLIGEVTPDDSQTPTTSVPYMAKIRHTEESQKDETENVMSKKTTGFSIYVGAQRKAWDTNLTDAIETARQVIRKLPTKDAFVPSVTIYDCEKLLIVGFVTDDANGVAFHQRNSVYVEAMSK